MISEASAHKDDRILVLISSLRRGGAELQSLLWVRNLAARILASRRIASRKLGLEDFRSFHEGSEEISPCSRDCVLLLDDSSKEDNKAGSPHSYRHISFHRDANR
jgi:hypothetical protein